MCPPFCEMLCPASSDSTFLLSPLIWDGVLAFQGSYFPLLLISCRFPSYWMLCLPVWVSFFPVPFLLSSSVSSCFLLFPFDILGAPGDYGTHVAWQIVWGLRRYNCINLADFRESISPTSEVWGLQPLDWAHQCATKPGCKFHAGTKHPWKFSEGVLGTRQLGTNKVPEVGSGTTLRKLWMRCANFGLGILTYSRPGKDRKVQKSLKASSTRFLVCRFSIFSTPMQFNYVFSHPKDLVLFQNSTSIFEIVKSSKNVSIFFGATVHPGKFPCQK